MLLQKSCMLHNGKGFWEDSFWMSIFRQLSAAIFFGRTQCVWAVLTTDYFH